MDLYISSVLLGAAGLAVMAFSGLGHHGHGAGARGGSHGHVGGHAGGHGSGHTGAHGGHGHHVGASHSHGSRDTMNSALWAIASPRFLFSFALGFGVAGELVRPVLGGALLLVAAIAGGVLFERAIVSPLWNFAMRFASTPAQSLESAVSDEAIAVTTFDANGQGIVSVEVDGQIMQILATLQPDDRKLGGARVRVGQRVRIDEVDAARNRCTVSLL
ncbi:MAG TPA: hypothetical protein VK636_18105 [Gemmatimonadaceae bacterium]|nr:hypothetical protein [Gemmatimonadaceae bacterium]